MKNTNEKHLHEKIINRTYVDENLDNLVLSSLDMFSVPIEDLAELFDIDEEIYMHDDFLKTFSKEDLKDFKVLEDSKKFKLNIDIFEADTDWVLQNDGNFGFYDNEDYTKKIQKAVDIIYPNNKSADKNLTPITFLIPNVNPCDLEGLDDEELSSSKDDYEKLDGVFSYSYWKFVTLKNESDGDKKGFQELAEDTGTFFGIRLFLALKALGIVSSSQYEKNFPKIFPEILQSTPLSKHFKLLDKDAVKKHKKLYTDIKKLEKKLDKLDREYSEIKLLLDNLSVLNDKRRARRKAINNEKTKIETLIDEKMDEIDEIAFELEAENEKANVYYSLPIETLVQFNNSWDRAEINPDQHFVIPTLDTSLSAPKFAMNKLTLNKGRPAPMIMRRMRFMLSYLFPMTCGTALTFYIKNASSKQKIKAPLLILPKVWDELAMALKEHDPKKEVSDFDNEAELEFREACVKNIHEKFWGSKSKFMRATVPITETSKSDVLKAKKKSPK